MRWVGRDAAAGSGAGLRSRFFDILHLDGEDLIDRPLADRLAANAAARSEAPAGAEIIPFSVYAGRPRPVGARHFDPEDEL